MALVHFGLWKKGRQFSPNSLLLDPRNYRFEQRDQPRSQAEIRDLLIEDGVADLASKIVTKGWMGVEDIVLVRDGKKYIVVEGNRRACALQLISNPNLAPQSHRTTFRRLHETVGNELPKKIHCVIAPNRTEADVYVFAKHADDGFRRTWERIRQAAFVVAHLESGETVTSISQQTGLSKSKITESAVAIDLIRIADTLDLNEATRALIHDPTTFNYTTLVERIFGNADVRRILGVTISEKGIRGVSGTKDGFLKVLKELLEDASQPKSTRLYGTYDESVDRVKKFGYEAKGAGSWSPSPSQAESPSGDLNPPSGSQKASGKGKGRKDYSDRLLPPDLVVEQAKDKLADMIDEAKKLSISTSLHSCAVFLRCIFELAVNEALDARSARRPLNLARNRKAGDEISIGLLLKELKQASTFDIGLEHFERRGIDHLVNNGPLSYDQFNLFIHNPHWPATVPAVKALRDQLLPILRKALLKP